MQRTMTKLLSSPERRGVVPGAAEKLYKRLDGETATSDQGREVPLSSKAFTFRGY